MSAAFDASHLTQIKSMNNPGNVRLRDAVTSYLLFCFTHFEAGTSPILSAKSCTAAGFLDEDGGRPAFRGTTVS
jgi:hypothetical protein